MDNLKFKKLDYTIKTATFGDYDWASESYISLAVS